MVDDDALNGRWMREQALLGLSRATPDEEFARGGLPPSPSIPPCGSPSFRAIHRRSRFRPRTRDGDPEGDHAAGWSAAPVPRDRARHVERLRGVHAGDEGRWQSFAAVHWHGGVDVFLGAEGGRSGS